MAANEVGTVSGRPTVVLDETATNSGPFDIEISLVPEGLQDATGQFGMRKTVVNGTGQPIFDFVLDIGRGTGESFVRRDELPASGNVSFAVFSIVETTGAFPTFTWSDERIVFLGRLEPGESAVFEFIGINTEIQANQLTVRQSLDRSFVDGFEVTP